MVNLTTIQLITSGGTELGYLDITENVIIPITFSIGDIRDLSKKNGAFSKSIKLKGTKVNNILFNNYYDVNILADSITFDINKRQFCRVLQNGVVVIDNALLQLIKVNKQQDGNNYDEQIEYTCLIKDTAGDFFTTINERFLDQLDLGLQNHTFNASFVTQSFGFTENVGFKYIMSFNPEDGNDTGYTQTFPIFKLEEFKPAIYAKRYWDYIFNTAGYRYRWDSMSADTIQFRKLLIPYNGDSIISDKTTTQYLAQVGNNAGAGGGGTGDCSGAAQSIKSQSVDLRKNFFYEKHSVVRDGKKTVISLPCITNNTSGNYNPATSTYTTPSLPSMTNYVSYNYTIQYQINVVNPYAFTIHFHALDIVNNHVMDSTVKGDLDIAARINITDENQKDTAFDPITYVLKQTDLGVGHSNNFPANSTTTLKAGNINGTVQCNNTEGGAKLQLTGIMDVGLVNARYGDSEVAFTASDNLSLRDAYIELKIISINIGINTTLDGQYGYNNKIEFFPTSTGTSTAFSSSATTATNPFAPKKVKQSDFIKSILTMFNLFIEVDKDDPQLLVITRRDDFYDTGISKDWTQKLVKNDDQDLVFIPEIKNKRILLTYKQDDDFANKNYEKDTNEIYGQQDFTFDNQYVKDTEKKELIFSPTPMTNLKFGAVVPMIDGSAPKNNIRILYDGTFEGDNHAVSDNICGGYFIENFNYSGKSYNTYQFPTGQSTIQGDILTTKLGNIYAVANNVYPFVSHQNKAVAPSYDINFGQCDFYYRDDNWFPNTNNNLFNNHWIRTLNNINVGKMLTARFVLTENDINALRLNDRILVNNSWWNINRVIDYDANSNEPTQVELISIDDAIIKLANTKIQKPVKQAQGQLDILRGLLSGARIPFINWNTSGGNVKVPAGSGNVINRPISSGQIFGSNNFIGGVRPIFLTGNGNVANNGGTIVGNGNFVQASDNYIIGNNNQLVGTSSSRNFIFGNDNFIDENRSGNFILGSNINLGTADTTDNTVYVNNLNIQSGGTFTIGGKTIGDAELTFLDAAASTGLYEFGSSGITVNTTTTVNVGNVKGWIVDSNDVLNSNPVTVNYTGGTNITSPFLGSTSATYFMVDTGSTLVMLGARPTATQRRQMIMLGVVGHPTGTITGIGNQPDIIMNEMSQVRAMFEPIRYINGGVTCYNAGTNLQLANTSGILYGLGIGFITNGNLAPTTLTIAGANPTTFQYRTQGTTLFGNTTFVDPTLYDVGGTPTLIAGGANSSTNQRIYLLANGVIRFQLGQTIYTNLASAIANAATEPFVANVNAINLGILIGILSIQRTCTNLSDVNTARFLSVSKFGETVGAAGGIATGNLQNAYNNSNTPEILTNASLGAFSVQRGSASDVDNVIEVYNGSTVLKSAIDGNGNVFATSFVKTGGLASEFLMANGSVSSASGFMTGSGTTNTISMFNSSNTITNSPLTVNAGRVLMPNINGTFNTNGFGFNNAGDGVMLWVTAVQANLISSKGNGFILGTNLNAPIILQTNNVIRGQIDGASGNWNIGTGSDNSVDKLQVAGTIQSTGFKVSGGTNQQFLLANGTVTTLATAGVITGLGTPNTITKWSTATGITNSIMFENAGKIGVNQTSPQSVFQSNEIVSLSATSGNFRLLHTIQGNPISNQIFINEFLVRNANGSDWTTASVHNGIQVDGSFNTPTTSKCFWERQPLTSKQFIGSDNAKTLTIDSANNRIGVNTTSPNEALTVYGNINNVNDASGTTIGFQTTDTFNNTFGNIGNYGMSKFNEAGQPLVGLSGYFGIRFYTGTAERMRIDGSGDLVLGHTSSLIAQAGRRVLTVNGTSQSLIVLGVGGNQKGYYFHDGTDMYQSAEVGNMRFLIAGAEKMRINTGGRVNIATTTDNGFDALTVGGSARVNQFAYTRAIAISGDLNNITDAGFYNGDTLTNAPTTGWYYYTVQRYDTDNTWVHQTATSFGAGNTANRIFNRTKISNVWSAWIEVITSNNSGTYTPTLVGTGTNFSGITLSNGVYTKVGNIVNFTFQFGGTNAGMQSAIFTVTLPIARTITTGGIRMASGSANDGGTVNIVPVQGNTVTNTTDLSVTFKAVSISSWGGNISGQYSLV